MLSFETKIDKSRKSKRDCHQQKKNRKNVKLCVRQRRFRFGGLIF